MIGNLYKSERFKEEVKRFDAAISQLEEGTAKENLKHLLSSLITEVKKMDNMYMDMVYTHQLGSMGNDFRSKIMSIRKQLEESLFKK